MQTRIVTGIKNHTYKNGGVFDSESVLFFDAGIKNHTRVTKRRGQKTEMQAPIDASIKIHTHVTKRRRQETRMPTRTVTGIKNHTHKSGGVFDSESVLFFDTGIKIHTRVTKRRG